MNNLERKITVRFTKEIEKDMRLAMGRMGVVKPSDFVRQAVVRAIADQVGRNSNKRAAVSGARVAEGA